MLTRILLPKRKSLVYLLLAGACLPALAGRECVVDHIAKKAAPAAGNGVVVMELFTSQGCSSCPPADAILAQYAQAGKGNIIPLAFHVDYWNRLGWTDPFSSAANSERQQWYGRYLTHGEIYTPMMIVNGKSVAVGNNAGAVAGMVDKAAGMMHSLQLTTERISIKDQAVEYRYHVNQVPPGAHILAALVQQKASTKIAAGENRGVNLRNVNMVRSWETAGLQQTGTVKIALPQGFSREGYVLVAFVQEKDLQITAACRAAIP